MPQGVTSGYPKHRLCALQRGRGPRRELQRRRPQRPQRRGLCLRRGPVRARHRRRDQQRLRAAGPPDPSRAGRGALRLPAEDLRRGDGRCLRRRARSRRAGADRSGHRPGAPAAAARDAGDRLQPGPPGRPGAAAEAVRRRAGQRPCGAGRRRGARRRAARRRPAAGAGGGLEAPPPPVHPRGSCRWPTPRATPWPSRPAARGCSWRPTRDSSASTGGP